MDLAYPLQNEIEIDGEKYRLNMAFDNVLRLFDMFEDENLTYIEKIQTALLMLINDSMDNYSMQEKEVILHQIIKNTIAKDVEESRPVDIAGNPMPDVPDDDKEKVYDLKQDAEYIYASFYSDYGIDLFEEQGKLHWEKFKALLNGLTDGSKFMKVIEIRTMELPTGKGSEKRRRQIKKLKEHYALKGDD